MEQNRVINLTLCAAMCVALPGRCLVCVTADNSSSWRSKSCSWSWSHSPLLRWRKQMRQVSAGHLLRILRSVLNVRSIASDGQPRMCLAAMRGRTHAFLFTAARRMHDRTHRPRLTPYHIYSHVAVNNDSSH